LYLDLNSPFKAIVHLVKVVKAEKDRKQKSKDSIQRLAGAYAKLGIHK
jgi:hypothetical protein